MKARRSADARTLAAYLEGEVTASERSAIDVELENSPEARRTLAQLRHLTQQLASPALPLESMDLATRVRAELRRPAVAKSAKRGSLPVLLMGLAACLGSVLLYFSHQPPADDEFRAKSSGAAVDVGARWAGIQAFRVFERGVPEPLGEKLASKDALLFSYTNIGPQPFDYLMIFGVDSQDEVRWFYPAYEAAGENPESVPVARGRANVPLGELVQQDLSAGPFALYALFSRRPFNVLDIEEWLKEHRRPAASSPLPGGSLQRIDVQVTP